MFTLSEMLKRNYKRIGCLLLLVLVFAMNLTACSQTSSTSQTTTNAESASLTELHFDTIMSISLYGSDKNEKIITGIKRISKPGLRVYAGKDEIPSVLGGLGIAILSTNKGIVTDKEAKKLAVGGEVLAFVW